MGGPTLAFHIRITLSNLVSYNQDRAIFMQLDQGLGPRRVEKVIVAGLRRSRAFPCRKPLYGNRQMIALLEKNVQSPSLTGC